MLMLHECVKTELVTPLVVDSEYAHAQQQLGQWHEEFHNHVALQRFWNADIQATGSSGLPDQNIIFDQNGILRDSNDFWLRHDPTHEPSDLGSPPLEYCDDPDGGDRRWQ
jgi:hypothetical protein